MAWSTYTSSGVYDSLFTNSSGCDSLVVLRSYLIIQILLLETACDPYSMA